MKSKLTRREFLRTSALTMMGATLAACAQQAPAAPQAAAPTAAPSVDRAAQLKGTSIRYVLTSGIHQQIAEKAFAPEFEKATGIKVVLDVLPYQNLVDKLTVSLSSKSDEYDVALIDETWIAGLSQYLQPLDELTARDSYDMSALIPNALAAGKHKEQQIALPTGVSVPVLWYMKDVLEAKGLNPPKTWEEALAMAPKVADPANNLAAYVLAGKKHVQVSVNSIIFLWSLGGDVITKEGKFGFDTPEGAKALELYVNMLKIAPAGALGYAGPEVIDAFKQGQAVMTHFWSGNGPVFSDPAKSKVADRLGWAPMPPYPMRGIWSLGIPQGSKKQDAAWEFLKWVTSKEGGKLAATSGDPLYTARRDVLSDPEVKKLAPWSETVIAALDQAKARPQVTQWPAIDGLIQTMGSEVLSGQASVADAIKKAGVEFDTIMKG